MAAALPIVAIVTLVSVVGFTVWGAAAFGTLGFDFLAYHQAAERVLSGQALYDPTIQTAGGFGLFYYPPSFAVMVLPFGVLSGQAAVWLWLGLSAAALVLAIWLMPVGPTVRWGILLLAGLSWPVVYALKLGQVGPLLLLLFTIGWRWRDRPTPLGVAGALGALIKIQPGLVLGWAFLTGRWGAVAIGAVTAGVATIVASLLVGGPSIWPDYLQLLRNVSNPITTTHNFTPGAVAFQLGAAESTAAAIQVLSSVLAILAVVYAARRLPSDASYLVAVVASQLLSPVLWDHYAMLLLPAIAYLLQRRHWWAAVIPLGTSVLLLPLGMPAVLIPTVFWLTLVALLMAGRNSASEPALAEARSASPLPASVA